MVRFLLTAILLVSSFLSPWWAVLLVCVLGVFWFDNYFESVAVAFLLDALYSSHTFFLSLPWLTLVMLVVLVVSGSLKGRFRMFSEVKL